MMLKKLLRTIWFYKAQFISMIIMVMLGAGVFIGFQGEWYSIKKNTYSFYDSTGFADYRIINSAGWSLKDYDRVKEINGIINSARYFEIKTNESKQNDVISLNVTTDIDVSGFVVTNGDNYDENSKDGVWISDEYAKKNDYKIGDIITLKYASVSFSGTIKGLIKSSEFLICVPDENQIMPDFDKFGYLYISPAMLKEKMCYELYTELHVLSKLDKKTFTQMLNEKLGKTNLIISKDEVISFSEAQGEAAEGKTMAAILPVIFLGIAILIMITTMQRIMLKEKTQMGILKALGFRDNRIIRHYTSIGLFVGIIGTILGIAFGFFITWFIFNPNGAMGTYFDLPYWDIYIPWWSFLIVLLIVVLMGLISFKFVKKTIKGTASDTLRPFIPKSMKHIGVERTAFWKRRSFVVKWNMRDILRNKAKTIMSLFGVFGCMILLVASFLMMDSMLAFVKGFYYGAMNYDVQMQLKDDTDSNTCHKIIEQLNCDYSATIPVLYNDDGISMDIYNTKNGLVRFLDSEMNYINLSDDGVYIGQRLLEENKLNIGDKITVGLFGSDKKYEFTISGTLRTLVKGIVMTENYAENIGVDHSINTLYSNKSIEEIQNSEYSSHISSIKNKSDIIKSFDSFMSVMYTMIGALVVFSILLGIVVLYNLGIMGYFEKCRELSTLKVIGFKDNKIARILIVQNIWITIVGIVSGFPFGVWVTSVLTKALASEYEMKLVFGVSTITVPVVLVFLVSMLVSFMVFRKSRKINMVEALKVAE